MTAAPREKNATWFEPQLAAQIAYQEWTTDQKLQQPAFPGRRKAAGNDKFRQEFELVAQLGVERTATLVRRESTMTVGRHIQCVPAGQDRARPFALIQPQQKVGKSDNCSTSPITAPANRFWQCMIGTVRKRIAIDNQQGTAHHDSLNYFRDMIEEKRATFSG